MSSNIDDSKPEDNIPANKSELRANFAAAKEEIEDLQQVTSLAYLIGIGLVSL